MFEINGYSLSLTDIAKVARDNKPVKISDEGRQAILASRVRLENIISSALPVYGINTGFGIFSDQSIPHSDSAKLSRNLILSHAVGSGMALPAEVVRAAMLVRANTLAKGFSGVRIEVVQTLVEMLNSGVTPIVPSQGSLGSSGDLAPLSHMALVFTTDAADRDMDSGMAEYRGQVMSGKEAMQKAGILRIILGAKEGLAVSNGATFSAAIAALAIVDAFYLLNVAEKALGLSLEALLGCSDAFDARLHQARGHRGQVDVARHIRELIAGSTLIDRTGRVQDAYSLRCAPQVYGPALDTIRFIEGVVEREVNAATDNPLIFAAGKAISGGNFHGEAIGMAMDFLGIASAEIAAISERRIFRLTDGKLNGGLPPMLVDRPEAAGLNSGLMMPQYTAASLVLENQTLAGPDSVRSLPTSSEQEDHNANAMTAARHARMIIENTSQVLAIELYTAARALILRLRQFPDGRLGNGTDPIFRQIQEITPYHARDAWWAPEIQKIRNLIDGKRI